MPYKAYQNISCEREAYDNETQVYIIYKREGRSLYLNIFGGKSLQLQELIKELNLSDLKG